MSCLFLIKYFSIYFFENFVCWNERKIDLIIVYTGGIDDNIFFIFTKAFMNELKYSAWKYYKYFMISCN